MAAKKAKSAGAAGAAGAAREAMAKRPGRASKGAVSRWFEENPEALQVVDEWLRMRRDGETHWGVQALVKYLAVNHGWPFSKSNMTLRNWLQRHREEEFADAYGEARG